MKNQGHAILLTFDVEEFDLPLEYGIAISVEEQMAVGKNGLDEIQEILNEPGINCTLFTTAHFALKYPAAIAALSIQHEIASHTYFHSSFKQEDLLNSKMVLENIISQKVYGLRMPRMKKINSAWIRDAGYAYDSSLNPTWIPGRYNNLGTPRTYFTENNIIKFPVSVSANFRIPLFWLAFKNFPYAYYKKIALQTLKKDGYLSLYFHPWEFTDLSSYNLPAIVKRKYGRQLLEKLKHFLNDLTKEGEFMSINSFLANGNVDFKQAKIIK